MHHTPKPLLLLDVDGPLNPYRQITKKGYLEPKVRPGETRYTYDKHLLRPPGWETGDPLPVLLSPAHGDALRALSDVFTLVWATTWEEHANRLLAPILDLPHLPVIEWPDSPQDWTRHVPFHRGSWKTRHIARWLDRYGVWKDSTGAVRRIPWVWVDDEINHHDRAWVRSHYNEIKSDPPRVERWLLRIEASHGLRERDFTELHEWAVLHRPVNVAAAAEPA